MTNPLFRYILQNQIISAILLVIFGWFLFEIRSILIAIFIAYIITAALSPAVIFLQRKGLPHVLAVAVPYFITLVFCILLIVPLVPFFIAQVQSLFTGFPLYLDKAVTLLGLQADFSEINAFVTSEFDTIGKNAITLTTRVFGGLFSLLTILVVSFYLLLESETIKTNLANLFPKSYHKQIVITFSQIEERLGAWLRGQLLLSIIIGIITWIALTSVELGTVALPLAILAGILEIVPTIGPIIASIPSIIIALTVSPATAVFVVIIYIVVQMLENNILVPKIMQRAVGLNPIVIIVCVMAGTKLMGVMGALLSIPLVSLLVIIYNNFNNPQKT